jgi:serine/threonine protein phosphatase PrpC
MKFSLAEDCRIGARPVNQDRVGHWQTSAALTLAVADGLGGHLNGEVAAQIAIDTLATAFQRAAMPRLTDPAQFLQQQMGASHVAILDQAVQMNLPEAPRTCLVACVVQDGQAWWTHVGDGRLYHIRDGRVLARTRDHTLVQQLVDAGRMREEAASTHPGRNRLLQCIGGYQVPRPDPVTSVRLEKGDILLLCSDGFWGPLTQRQLLHSLLTRPLAEAIPELMALAESRAGAECDNVSALAMSWQDEALVATATGAYGTRTEIKDMTATDVDFLHTSDEDVDKAIAELKNALRKNVP